MSIIFVANAYQPGLWSTGSARSNLAQRVSRASVDTPGRSAATGWLWSPEPKSSAIVLSTLSSFSLRVVPLAMNDLYLYLLLYALVRLLMGTGSTCTLNDNSTFLNHLECYLMSKFFPWSTCIFSKVSSPGYKIFFWKTVHLLYVE